MRFSVGSTLKSPRSIKLSKFEEKASRSHFFFLLFYKKALFIDTSELSNEGAACRHHVCLCLICMVWWTLQVWNWAVRNEESILVSEINKTSIFLLTILTNESNLIRIESILSWANIHLLKIFRRMFFRIFCGFNIGCLSDADVSFTLAEMLD